MISLCQKFCYYWSLKAVVAWIWDYIARAKWGQKHGVHGAAVKVHLLCHGEIIDCSAQNRLAKKECKLALVSLDLACERLEFNHPTNLIFLQEQNPVVCSDLILQFKSKKQEARSSEIRFFQQDFVAKQANLTKGSTDLATVAPSSCCCSNNRLWFCLSF